MDIDKLMENRSFRYTYLKEIRKDKARKLFNAGIEIYILPKQLNPLSYYNHLLKIKYLENSNFDDFIGFERNNKFEKNHFYIL